MKFGSASAVFLCAATMLQANPMMPTSVGIIWEYSTNNHPPAQGLSTTVEIVGTEELAGKNVLKVETRAAGVVTKTELISVSENGIYCHQRTGRDGNPVSFAPPQTVVPSPLKIGAKWELDDESGGAPMHQRFTAESEEVVNVPAGTYQAFRLHAEQPWPISVAVNRWFAPGIGVVKDVTTTRGPTGRLLSRATTVLTKVAQIAPRETAVLPPSPTPAPPAAPPVPSPNSSLAAPNASPPRPTILLEAAAERDGEPRTEFTSDAPNIFVRWQGEALPINAPVRVAWVAEDVGDVAPPNFIVDETETIIARADFGTRFTLSRPQDGWATGQYRVDLYLDDELLQSLKVTISD